MDLLEEKADRAFELQKEVVTGSLSARRAWVQMAAALYAIQSERLYELLGYERFTEWIATPEISLGRSQAYYLTSIYQTFVVEKGIPLDDLSYIEPSKLAETLPAVRSGADVGEALADATELSRSDLRAKYRGMEPEPEEPKNLSICPECGQAIKPTSRSNQEVSHD